MSPEFVCELLEEPPKVWWYMVALCVAGGLLRFIGDHASTQIQ